MKLTALCLMTFVFSIHAESLKSHFECRQQGAQRFRPYFMQVVGGGNEVKDWSQTSKGLLGQNAMSSIDECQRAVDAANNEYGAICSRTGLDGWKPTTYTGTYPGRTDFGYLGGSSIMSFDNCLNATRHSSIKGVCFWGGSDWFISPIDKEGLVAGPFSSIDECVRVTQN